MSKNKDKGIQDSLKDGQVKKAEVEPVVPEDFGSKLDKVVASMNKGLDVQDDKIDNIAGAVKALTAAANPELMAQMIADAVTKAVDTSMHSYTGKYRNALDADEHVEENAGTAEPEIDLIGDGVIQIKGSAELMTTQEGQTQLQNLMFNEERVIVLVHESSDEFADPVVCIEVNGQKQIFVRGEDTVCRRKFLEGLARAKRQTYGNKETTDRNGDKTVIWPARRGLRYPMSVVRDDNKRGPSWLKGLLKEA